MFRLAVLVLLVPIAWAGSADDPEWRDDILDTEGPNPFLDVTAGWVLTESDDSFTVNLQLAVLPPVPGIGAANNGIMYAYYHHYVVQDSDGVTPDYEICPDYLTSWLNAVWWGESGPQDDAAWSFHHGCTGQESSFETIGEVAGRVDMAEGVITWIVPRGLPQALVPPGCDAQGWTLNNLHGEAASWDASLGLQPHTIADVGPNQGYGRVYEFPICEGWVPVTPVNNVTYENEITDQLTFPEPFNGTLNIDWATRSENVTVRWDANVSEGSLAMVLFDDQQQIFDVVASDIVHGEVGIRDAAAGNWSLELQMHRYEGEFAFQIIDAELDRERANETSTQQPLQDKELQHGANETTEQQSAQDLESQHQVNETPHLPILTTLLLVALLAYFKR